MGSTKVDVWYILDNEEYKTFINKRNPTLQKIFVEIIKVPKTNMIYVLKVSSLVGDPLAATV